MGGEEEGTVSGAPRPSMVEEVGIVFGLVVVQLVFASYGVAMGRLLMMGLDPIALVVYGCLATVVFLSPLAIAFERVTSFQLLTLVGIKKTSPAIASAMPNLAPGFIFIIAGCLGFTNSPSKDVLHKCLIQSLQENVGENKHEVQIRHNQDNGNLAMSDRSNCNGPLARPFPATAALLLVSWQSSPLKHFTS
ncbi:WAT1-related protein [Acorus calamus]|uniref:WAT1-related protein n=1 Tax=Acorus calamus TaxID=4465 RepID=A0AAV9DTD6_ACOCL|nr:WAT1-related protein [Acorus calamus]